MNYRGMHVPEFTAEEYRKWCQYSTTLDHHNQARQESGVKRAVVELVEELGLSYQLLHAELAFGDEYTEGCPYCSRTWLTKDQRGLLHDGYNEYDVTTKDQEPGTFPAAETIREWQLENLAAAEIAWPQCLPPKTKAELVKEASIANGGDVPDILPNDVLGFLSENESEVQMPEGADQDMVWMLQDNVRLEAPHRLRIEQCGALRYKPIWQSGMLRGYYQKCELFRYCPKCAQDRAADEMNRVTEQVGNKTLYQLTVAKGGDVKNAVRALDTNQYRRYPIEGEITIILTTDAGAADRGARPVKLADVNWRELTQTPQGSKPSGRMRSAEKKAAPKKEENETDRTGRIEVLTFQIEANGLSEDDARQEYVKCWELAVLATIHLPVTLDTIEMVIGERMRHFRSSLAGAGYKVIYSVYVYEHVVESQIDWIPYNNYIRDKLHKKGYFNMVEQADKEWEVISVPKMS